MKFLILIPLALLSSCSTFESFHLKMAQEIAYGDTAVTADGAADVAKIEADKEVMLAGNEPHTVQVLFPLEDPPDGGEVPIVSAPLAVTPEGIVLYDCVPTKGGLVECRGDLSQ